MLPRKRTNTFVVSAKNGSPNGQSEMKSDEKSVVEENVCALCEAKQDCKQSITRENLDDIKIRGIVTFAYAKATKEIPSCKVCTRDYFHHVLLKWRGREDLLLEHSCQETRCDEYIKNSWLVPPIGKLPLRHTLTCPFEESSDDEDKENKI